MKLVDLRGKQFGELEVICRVENTGHCKSLSSGFVTYRCFCDCGKIVNVTANRLMSGNTKSCGCLRKKKVSARNKKRIGKKHPNWKGGRKKNTQGYILIHRPDHPSANSKGYVFEHRLVMEKMLGRYLCSEEVVHHTNEMRDDNREENLVLFANNGEHTKHEWELKRIANHT